VDNLYLEQQLLRNTTVTAPVHVVTMHVFGTIILEDRMLRSKRLWLHALVYFVGTATSWIVPDGRGHVDPSFISGRNGCKGCADLSDRYGLVVCVPCDDESAETVRIKNPFLSKLVMSHA
jgi:hypothetical protein